MSRIVSVWLPRWPILRALAAQLKNVAGQQKSIAPERPFVLVAAAAGEPRIAALNEAAEALGLAAGEPLADARAKAGIFLQVHAADPAADRTALRSLTLWATRYTPTASPYDEDSGADGFFLDVEGVSHLFGGEEKLLADLAARLADFGLPARLAMAATPGAAWALSRFHPASRPILPPGLEAEALSPLPVEALRLEPDTCTALRRLGFKTIGALVRQPRAPFAARFSAQLLRRLDQALGRRDEPLTPVVPPPVYHALRYLIEPLVTQEAVVALARRLMDTLTRVLSRDDVGARTLKLSLYRIDGAVKTLDIALTLPTRNAEHVARMIALKLEAAAATDDAGFGFEAIDLAVTCAQPMPARQMELTSAAADRDKSEQCAALIDALRQRLGPASVRSFAAVESHIPERAEVLAPVTGEDLLAPSPTAGSMAEDPRMAARRTGMTPRWSSRIDPLLSGGGSTMRPLLLLPHAEPAEVMVLVPDGPPRRFCWRGVSYEVTGAQGPERIGAEWWRGPPPYPPPQAGKGKGLSRDYYVVEDKDGHRFWLFREGLYERETAAARWFVHGLLA